MLRIYFFWDILDKIFLGFLRDDLRFLLQDFFKGFLTIFLVVKYDLPFSKQALSTNL